MLTEKTNIFGMTPDKLSEYFKERLSQSPAKAGAVFEGIYRRGIKSFAELGFNKRVTAALERDFTLSVPETVSESGSPDAVKLLLRLADGEYTETVIMRREFGSFLCVSTEVGCDMGCAFCKSGQMKKRRSLKPHEITGQIMAAKRLGDKIKGVSVMGIGEPFDEYGKAGGTFDSVREFLDIIRAPKGLAVGDRHITVSTCGIVPAIYAYAEMEHPCNLAVSLHAPTDELRNRLMPINRAYPLKSLFEAVGYFSSRHNRRVMLEYVMLDGVNDSPELARRLCGLIDGRDFFVNIITYNESGCGFKPSSRDRVMSFYDVLKKHKVGVTIRKKLGSEINAACGQLRADYIDHTAPFQDNPCKSP